MLDTPAEARLARRAIGDVTAVCRHAYPGTAARWMTSLVAHLPECARSRSLAPADRIWARTGARFRTSTGAALSLASGYTSGAREMYCRNVYLRTGLTMPTSGWVMDLGANNGLFSVWAAVTGAQVVAVEAQQGFATEIRDLAAYNGVTERVHIEVAMASGVTMSGASVGAVADDHRWAATSHGTPARPADMSVPGLMAAHGIDRLGLLKIDIEGGEFAVLAAGQDLSWLERVDQLALEFHRDFGDPAALIEPLRQHGFVVDLRDNDGRRVSALSGHLDYAYCRRGERQSTIPLRPATKMRNSMNPRLGILDFNPIQYHTPLYQRMTRRGNVTFDVLFLSDRGYRSAIDPGFGVAVAWNIDLLSGYSSRFLATIGNPEPVSRRLRKLTRWLLSHDVVIVHGYVDPWMLFAMALCRIGRVPYLLRGESHPRGQSAGFRRKLRDAVARTVVSASAGGLAIGQLNEQFYRRYRARAVTFAPYSVDDQRFAAPPDIGRSELLARWGLPDDRPVILFCGKLIPRKRPLDLTAAVKLLPGPVTTLFVGEGVLADQVRAGLDPGRAVVTGFVNQSELPAYFHAADILVLPSEAEPWGLVVNEAMAAGTLPVVSDRVGSAPDLVSGIGEVYPCGDVTGLAAALSRALVKAEDPGIRDQVRWRVAQYSLEATAAGFEEASLNVVTSAR
jgi:FkbM family methyltransferase